MLRHIDSALAPGLIASPSRYATVSCSLRCSLLPTVEAKAVFVLKLNGSLWRLRGHLAQPQLTCAVETPLLAPIALRGSSPYLPSCFSKVIGLEGI